MFESVNNDDIINCGYVTGASVKTQKDEIQRASRLVNMCRCAGRVPHPFPIPCPKLLFHQSSPWIVSLYNKPVI